MSFGELSIPESDISCQFHDEPRAKSEAMQRGSISEEIKK
jgi:hypothetical protein